jgi:heme oxygenase
MQASNAAAASARDVLRAATRARHVAVGNLPGMRRIFADDYSSEEYAAHLARMLGFFEPLERVAADRLTAAAAPHFLPRAAALRGDLAHMGWTAAQIAAVERCASLPDVPPEGIFGYLYVVLGSMLGGRIIEQRLSGVLGARAGLRYYGEGSGASDDRWATFCCALDAADRERLGAICDTANAIFTAFERWMTIEEQPQTAA